MWVKICANTSLQDTVAAIDAGADAVGFVFAPSKRQVTPDQVRAITRELPAGTERVGVFPSWPAEQIAAAALHAGLTTVQLHGGHDAALTGKVRRLARAVQVIEVAHWTVGADRDSLEAVSVALRRIRANEAAVQDSGGLRRVLVDAKVNAASGGTGVAFDWECARPVFAPASGLSLILAGGLRPENVREAVRTLRPWGVDVASGVESEPGRKDAGRLRSFVEQARLQG